MRGSYQPSKRGHSIQRRGTGGAYRARKTSNQDRRYDHYRDPRVSPAEVDIKMNFMDRT